MDVSGKEQTVSPHAFLKVDMTKKVITKIVLKCLDDTYTYATYKVRNFYYTLFYLSSYSGEFTKTKCLTISLSHVAKVMSVIS